MSRTTEHSDQNTPMSDLWRNRAPDIYQRRHSEADYRHQMEAADQECIKSINNGGGVTGKLALSMVTSGIKKRLCDIPNLCRNHGVGAVGYAVVQCHPDVPANDFFVPERKFRIRFRVKSRREIVWRWSGLHEIVCGYRGVYWRSRREIVWRWSGLQVVETYRHSNVNCSDDAASCVREAAIKFADQNYDGPLDLILTTGQRSLARNAKTLSKVLHLATPADVRKMCKADPYYYIALIDGLRRAPASFSQLTYYTQYAYQLTTTDGRHLAARFRLIPSLNEPETGLLQGKEQEEPWNATRHHDEKRSEDYLRQEFIDRVRQDEPVSYVLQIQTRHDVSNPITWHPQQTWNEPWLNVALIQLTTFMPERALRRTYFNLVEKPRCLSFPSASSPTDPHSLTHLLSAVYNKYEDDKICQVSQEYTHSRLSLHSGTVSAHKRYIVSLCTAPLKESGTVPSVDVFITFCGTDSRTTPQQLSSRLDGVKAHWIQHCSSCDVIENYEMEVDEDVGDLLTIIVSIRHRQLVEHWYLARVYVVSLTNENEQNHVYCFPCNSIVLTRVTLRTGEGCLAEKQRFEVHRQERKFELCERRHQYQWAPQTNNDKKLPAHIAGATVKDLPEMDRLRAAKFTGLRWDVDPAIIEYFRYLLYDIVDGSKRQYLEPVPRKSVGGKLFDSAKTSSVKSASSKEEADRRTLLRQYSVIVSAPVRVPTVKDSKPHKIAVPLEVKATPPGGNKAKSRWNLVKNVIKFTAGCNFAVVLPEGAKGDMCRAVQSDVDFGRIFLCGPNPVMLQRCTTIPQDRLPVTNDLLKPLLHRTRNLEQEARNGYVYLADYSLLHGIKTVEKDADRRYIAAPLVLLYVHANGDLVPLAIQLQPIPGSNNPIWTPLDRPQNWMLAKLWVFNADFHWQFAISHLFRCHWLMEPFVIATMRQLSAVHPVYKLLKPYFRYTLITNTILRTNLFNKFGPLNRYTSLGVDGFHELVHRYWSSTDCFRFTDLNPVKEMARRGVDDTNLLPGYFYRDDSLKLWEIIKKTVEKLMSLFYVTPDDVVNDSELKEWLNELRRTGFAGRDDFPAAMTSIDDLTDLLSCIIFTLTGQHSATHFDALDLYGFIPDVPALMRKPVPEKKQHTVTRNVLSSTLPDQFADAYYVSLAYVMQVHKPDENVMESTSEIFFTETEVIRIINEFRSSLAQLTFIIHCRNDIMKVKYENLIPALIPTSAEPVPYIPATVIKEAVTHGPKLSRDLFVKMAATNAILIAPVELMSLPVCLHFATTLGGRSFIGRRMVSPAKKVNSVFGTGANNQSVRARRLLSDTGTDEIDQAGETEIGEVSAESRRQQFRTQRLQSVNF